MEPFIWNRYTKKMHDLLRRPLSIGTVQSVPQEMIVCSMQAGAKEEGNWFEIHLIIDTSDGVIADAKYRFFGPTILLITLEAISRYVVRKHIRQVQNLTAEIIDRTLRDQDTIAAYKDRETPYLVFVLDGVFQALESAPEIAVSEYATPLESLSGTQVEQLCENWMELGSVQRLEILEKAFEEQIRPYLAIDEGGVQILGIEDDTKVKIAYSGSCTSCYSAIGGTLQGIQSLLQEKVYKGLTVVPDMESLHFH
ncbi:MAG: NifU family protein [Chlamydiia bacterium]